MIRNLACFIADEICKDDSGFQWEKYVQQLRQESKLRSHFRLRPYNVEIIVCSVIALSPVVKGVDFANKPSSFFWLIFTIITLILSAVNWREYNRSLKIRK